MTKALCSPRQTEGCQLQG